MPNLHGLDPRKLVNFVSKAFTWQLPVSA